MTNVLDFMPYGKDHPISRASLVMMTGLPDREVRHQIQDAKIMYPIVHCTDGYYIATDPEDVNLRAYVRQEKARALTILKNLKKHNQLLNNVGQYEFDFEEGEDE